MKKLALLVVITLALPACTRYANNGDRIYALSHNGIKLVVPPPLTDDNLSSFYVLPPQEAAVRVVVLPPVELV